MAETLTIPWSSQPAFTPEDPNCESGDMSPEHSLEDPPQKMTKITTQSQRFIKLFR